VLHKALLSKSKPKKPFFLDINLTSNKTKMLVRQKSQHINGGYCSYLLKIPFVAWIQKHQHTSASAPKYSPSTLKNC